MPRGYRDTGYYQGGWYKTINPNEHTYTPGYGFSPRPPALVEQRLVVNYATALGAAMLGFYLLNTIVPVLVHNLVRVFALPGAGQDFSEIALQLAALISAVLSLSIPFLLYCAYIKIPMTVAAPSRPVSSRLLVCSVLVCLGVAVVAAYCIGSAQAWFSAFGIEFDLSGMDPPKNYTALALYAVNLTVVPAVFEELVFRGAIMQSLRRFGDGFALLCSALLFAFVHVNPVRLPNAFLLGLAIGYFVMFTGSIRTGIAIHFVHNFCSLLLVLAGNLPNEMYYLWEMVSLLLGVAGLAILMRHYSGLFELRASDSINSEGCKLRSFWCSPLIIVLMIVTLIMAMSYVVAP